MMNWKFASTTVSLTAALTCAFGAYALWGVVSAEPSLSWFAALASQRDVGYVAGLALPITAMTAGLLLPGHTARRPFPVFATCVIVAGTAFALMAFVAPFADALIMRFAVPAQGIVYESQGWSHWWQLYAAGLDGVAQSLGMSDAEARPFWRAAGLFAWQPIYVASAAIITTVIGLRSAVMIADSARETQRTVQVLVPALVAGVLFLGWTCGRILSVRFDVPPETSLALMLVGPALLLCGMLIRDVPLGRADSR